MNRRIYRQHIERAHLIADRLARAPEPVRPAIPVDDSRARITVAPAFVDRRFAPDAGYVGAFAAAGIGRYEPDTGPDTEGMGFCDE